MKYFRVRNTDGVLVPAKQIAIGIPSEDILKKYEVKKDNFVDDVMSDLLSEVDKKDEKKNGSESAFNIEKRNEYLDKRRNEDGKIYCLKCKRVAYILTDSIKCRWCGHIESIS